MKMAKMMMIIQVILSVESKKRNFKLCKRTIENNWKERSDVDKSFRDYGSMKNGDACYFSHGKK